MKNRISWKNKQPSTTNSTPFSDAILLLAPKIGGATKTNSFLARSSWQRLPDAGHTWAIPFWVECVVDLIIPPLGACVSPCPSRDRFFQESPVKVAFNFIQDWIIYVYPNPILALKYEKNPQRYKKQRLPFVTNSAWNYAASGLVLATFFDWKSWSRLEQQEVL